MKMIKLTQNKVALVDDEDFDYLNQWKWFAHKSHNTYYAVRNGTQINNKRESQIAMHSLIMCNSKGLQIDHRDHNGLNNQKSNLRICDFSQNNCNRKPYGKSKYLGVSFNDYGRVRATIKINGKQKHLGYFGFDEIAAAYAYDAAAKKYHGEFSNYNFPENVK